MHTRVDILLCSQKSEEELLSVAERIHEALSYLEKTANYYDPASELAVVNRTASVSPVVLSSQLYAMVDLCLEYHEKTSGCFDVTVHSENYNQDTIHSVCLSAEEQSIFYRQPGITINLSGFLKGYALETIRDILHSCSIENALINMGNSSVLALGNHRPERDGKLTLATSRRRKRPGSLKVYSFIMNASLLPETSRRGAGILFLLKMATLLKVSGR